MALCSIKNLTIGFLKGLNETYGDPYNQFLVHKNQR